MAPRQRLRDSDSSLPSAVVVGAGVFGGSLALRLVSSGWDVTLVEQYPPGHVRAASGGESRLIRFAHGDNAWYTRSSRRALDLWRELERETGAELFVPSGVAWFFSGAHGWGGESERVLKGEGRRCVERLDPAEGARLFPSFDGTGPRLDPVRARGGSAPRPRRDAGHRRARDRARRAVRHRARPCPTETRCSSTASATRPTRSSGRAAPGSPSLFPGVVDLRVTRQDVYFFGAPAGWQAPSTSRPGSTSTTASTASATSTAAVQGEPGPRGPAVRPRRRRAQCLGGEGTRSARLSRAPLPGPGRRPLVGTRSCPYSLTEDTNFLITPHPEHERRLALRRRLGPRLQARARARGVRGAAAGRCRGARPRRSGSERGHQGAVCAPPGSSADA